MFIRKQAFNHLGSLHTNLDEAKRKRFLVILLKAGSKGIEGDISRIKIVDVKVFDV